MEITDCSVLRDQNSLNCDPNLVVQIMLGIIQLTFGFVLYYNDSYSGSVGASWPGVSYIVSGVLSVLVKKGSKKALLVGNLVMNILSTVAAGVGIVIYSILLWTGPVCFARFCAPWHFLDPFRVLVACLLVSMLLEYVISFATFTFSCAGIRCCEMDYEVITTVIQLATAQNAPAQELQDENYETLLAGCSTYEALNFKGQSNFRPGESDYINPI
ncbi:membrane-spanning 4-domains subfamily A member 12-like isoform X7 [Scyliorhinus canicula]|uniref:membrane-spanning 4-domains subfamily A member 12-like isoform X3 n=1 Tax=Scyliorhinus canicula TaxID=7830 RepID=UPI0018F56940|nr:membrane-spanning 4-domains subfamily A member 12-like isoform X3 [Scyliorhinus canicula]XP_038673471.1 membrane-spanning 4-domains subfamily A member 12-like isoform X7 [Scyliorhinus canicula]